MSPIPETSTGSVQEIIAGMQQQGFALSLTSTGGLAVTPASRLDDQQRALIRDHRAAIMAHLTAANDSTAHPEINTGTVRPPPGLSPKMLAASLALDAQIAASGALPADPDRNCWPHTQAANSSELKTMATRLERFARIGMDVDQAERLADKLLTRDREGDDRHVCVECLHCQHGQCSNSRAAGLNHPELGRDYALTLKRCGSYAAGAGTLAGTSFAFVPIPPRPAPRPQQQQYHPLTPDQQQASRDYNIHHFACERCISAGQGRGERCQRGTALWTQYTQDKNHD